MPDKDLHFTHFDAAGQAHMVDVAAKAETHRVARARGRIRMLPQTLAMIETGGAKKGDVLGVARLAAIQAAKKSAELIPLCHPLPLTRVAVEFGIDRAANEGMPIEPGRDAVLSHPNGEDRELSAVGDLV